MVAEGISSTAFLAVELTCRCERAVEDSEHSQHVVAEFTIGRDSLQYRDIISPSSLAFAPTSIKGEQIAIPNWHAYWALSYYPSVLF